MKKLKKIISTALVATMVLSMALTAGCGKKDNNASKEVLTVNDTKIHMDEMMYYILMQEFQLAQTEQMYQAYFGQSYLDSEYSEGVTVREMAKTSTMDAVTTYEVLYQEAVKNKYKLTEEEGKQCDESVTQLMAGITEEQLKLTGLTEETIREITEKMTIGLRYMQDTIDKFDIDDEAIKAGINKDEYRQYNTEYLFVSTAKSDTEGKAITPTEEEKKAAKAKLEAVVEKVKVGEEFAKIVEADATIQTQTSNFIKGKSTQGEEYEKAALLVENEKVSDIVETKDGYFIIKMIDNNSQEAYTTACTDAVSKEEQTQFTAKYEELKKDYKIKINEDVWGPIVMGENTIVKTAPETGEGTVPVIPEEETAKDDTATDDKAKDEATE